MPNSRYRRSPSRLTSRQRSARAQMHLVESDFMVVTARPYVWERGPSCGVYRVKHGESTKPQSLKEILWSDHLSRFERTLRKAP